MTEKNPYQLSEKQNQAIFDRQIKQEVFFDVSSVDRPIAVIYGGQPGSGKTESINQTKRELAAQGGVAIIEGDAFREHHPANKDLMRQDDKTAALYTGADSGKWVEKAIDHAVANRYNIIVEGTMRSPDVVRQTLDKFREAGYEIHAKAIAVRREASELSIQMRYETQRVERGFGRMTTQEAHNAAYDGVPKSLEQIEQDKLANHVAINTRQAENIYQNELKNGRWTQPPTARAALESERHRQWSLDEIAKHIAAWNHLEQMMVNRGASSEEMNLAKALRQSHELSLAPEHHRLSQQFDGKPIAEIKAGHVEGKFHGIVTIGAKTYGVIETSNQVKLVPDHERLNGYENMKISIDINKDTQQVERLNGRDLNQQGKGIER